MDTVVSGEINSGSTKHAALVPNHTSEEEDDDDDIGGPGSNGKSRRELPNGAVATLKSWLLSPEHFTHPYPTPQDQIMLMTKTGIDKKQLKNWFTNARRRIWKPMLKKQLEAGKLAALGAGNNGSSGGGVSHIPQGLGGGGSNGGSSSQPMSQQQQQQQMPQQEMYNNFQSSQNSIQQQQQQQQQYDQSHYQEQHQYEQNGQQQQQQVRYFVCVCVWGGSGCCFQQSNICFVSFSLSSLFYYFESQPSSPILFFNFTFAYPIYSSH
jgi:hypothetical protein